MNDAITQMLAEQDAAETPFTRFPDTMPHSGLDMLAPVVAPSGAAEHAAFDDFAARSRNLARVFAGAPLLHLIHAQCITLLRRRSPPPDIAPLFNQIWRDHGTDLARDLPVRWLISAATTFADHGQSPAARQTGEGLATLFGTLKLSETERLFSGFAPDQPFRPGRSKDPLPFDMQPYAINGGDLDRVLITRIWRAGTSDPSTTALTKKLLENLITESRGVFARLRTMRQRRNTS